MGAFRIQDIIGLILAILIVAILVSIILILRESARERRRWVDEEEEEEGGKERKRQFFTKPWEAHRGKSEASLEIEAKKRWSSLPRERKERDWREIGGEEGIEEVVEEVVKEERVIQEEKVTKSVFSEEQVEEKEKIPKGKEPKQVILERALRKIEGWGVDFAKLKPVITEDMLVFSPLLWEVRGEVRSGKELGEIVVHTVFRTIPGYSGEEIVERYRSGDVSIVEKLEARIRTPEGRDFLVATLSLDYFHIPELEREVKKGNLDREEYELLRALKFVDRVTKKEFARTVYAQIMSEED